MKQISSINKYLRNRTQEFFLNLSETEKKESINFLIEDDILDIHELDWIQLYPELLEIYFKHLISIGEELSEKEFNILDTNSKLEWFNMLKKSFIYYSELDFWEEHWLNVWYINHQIDWRNKQINSIFENE
jgi:hypothetical protein